MSRGLGGAHGAGVRPIQKIERMNDGEVFRVPIRDIIERGVKEHELDKYPLWEED